MLSKEQEKQISEGHVEELPFDEVDGFVHDLDLTKQSENGTTAE